MSKEAPKKFKVMLGDRVAYNGPGVYIVRSGTCISHIGRSDHLRNRLYKLSSLREHRGSSEVLCAAFCTGKAPEVEIEAYASSSTTKTKEKLLKERFGEPPVPAMFIGCKNGSNLREALLGAAGPHTREAGYIEAMFDVGEDLKFLFTERFNDIWRKVGKPPGPWSA